MYMETCGVAFPVVFMAYWKHKDVNVDEHEHEYEDKPAIDGE